MAYDSTLVALANPTRRALFEALCKGDMTVGSLAKTSKVSQPAVSQHLLTLRNANLVSVHAAGAKHYYRANRQGLLELRNYIERFWDDILDAYANGPGTETKTNAKENTSD